MLEEIGPYCFNKTHIRIIFIPSSVKNIKEGAFYWCRKLHTVDIREDS